MSKVSVIVSGHGLFATGIKGALNLLVDIPKNWSFIDFADGMSEEQLDSQFRKVIKTLDSSILFFTDLAGGTPYKVAATLAAENPAFTVVAGCNLGSLLESIFGSYSDSQTYAQDLVAASKKGINIFSSKDLVQTNSEAVKDADTDGI